MNSFDKILAQNEGKTLEFKENLSSPEKILKTAVAFANTAGGKIVIGIKNHPKMIIGLVNVQHQEERLVNLISDSISPQLIPDIQIIPWRKVYLIMVEIHFSPQPFYLKSEGPENGVYIRHGSTNRKATPELIKEIKLLVNNSSFDEQPCLAANSEAVDFRVASELFAQAEKKLDHHKLKMLKLLVNYQGKEYPSNGSILIFGINRTDYFPNAVIRCARFKGTTRLKIIDQSEITTYLPIAVEQAISFIERNTREQIAIGRISHRKIPEYPTEVIREAVINAIVHADYVINNFTIQIAIFDDRIEITNPGELPFGLTLEDAIGGISILRNQVIGRVFKELNLIEQWGSGLARMIEICNEAELHPPEFKEMSGCFRVTIYNEQIVAIPEVRWVAEIKKYIRLHDKITTKEASALWSISDRAARTRIRKLVDEEILEEIGKGPNDPKRYYVLKNK
ncbi:MAG TPA: ATP-binding protein [Candidatus Marinimicrobia bacterium]|nr:ATP-binding protein [Candidatus Neomarinimicrobiota bacterium]HRS52006.1 ATP-binding protein [Candidatus Neomarinimicrobiota bacterium]HRU91865.1 ATP-binding protein [Candidatus Neomarinimicrobiota bacterium]